MIVIIIIGRLSGRKIEKKMWKKFVLLILVVLVSLVGIVI